MQAPNVRATRAQLLDPQASLWDRVPAEPMAMRGTPLGAVPSNYVKALLPPDAPGTIQRLTAAALHNGEDLVFRVQWEVAEAVTTMAPDGSTFPDACGIAFPLRGDAPIQDMGSPNQPVNAWHWRADRQDLRAVIASGLGTTEWVDASRLFGAGMYQGGQWSVCLGRPLVVPEAPDGAVALTPGTAVKVGFAVWAGYKRERGPIKTFSDHWRELQLEA